ncbi:MAG: hypothetical protein GPOALKHO_000836 [Sodalis sp.]|uniref:hypothetical protein n=1 Tax=Sodalis sp. (in: enterobacteria) TaxID=1898979 RepID=UPI00387306F6|nr:MAG: hypothetical protein GPOALKHO_000836 [Sodalis sp.]
MVVTGLLVLSAREIDTPTTCTIHTLLYVDECCINTRAIMFCVSWPSLKLYRRRSRPTHVQMDSLAVAKEATAIWKFTTSNVDIALSGNNKARQLTHWGTPPSAWRWSNDAIKARADVVIGDNNAPPMILSASACWLDTLARGDAPLLAAPSCPNQSRSLTWRLHPAARGRSGAHPENERSQHAK